ncbi:MAG: GNAT family N-acetyltransferase [Haloferacaceae archaeon]|jgi:N-acetylglutamate synthase-like GNAT family acetyltransferase
MYVRDARNRDEAWLLDRIEELGLSDVGFRSRDFVLAVDETSDERAGFGRLRVHGDDEVCELADVGVPPAWRGQGVGAHVVERLVERAGDAGCETVYCVTDEPGYLTQFGFDVVERDDLPAPIRGRDRDEAAVPTALSAGAFEMPARLREAFKTARPRAGGPDDDEPEPDVTPEEFGIDPDEATYKYDTGD